MSSLCAAWPKNGRAVALLGAAASWLLTCGCSDDSHRLGGVNDEHTPLCAEGAEIEYIDRMEDGEGAIEFTEGRTGFWFAFNDLSVGPDADPEENAEQYPDRNGETFPMGALEPARADSRYAAHSFGDGFTDWGAGIGFELRVRQPYDLSRYAGISFWAKRGPQQDAESRLQLALPDRATSPIGGVCDDAHDLCHDDFGKIFTLDTELTHYSFLWRELEAQDWSEQHLPGMDASQVYGIRFQAGFDPEHRAFDFWIDDVALLCHGE
jgi:hypothetical protein